MDSTTGNLKANGTMHVICMGGKTSYEANAPVIFIDSMDTTLDDGHVLLSKFVDNPGHKLNVNGELMNFEDFYDQYGGDATTWSGDKAKHFVGVTDIKIIYLD